MIHTFHRLRRKAGPVVWVAAVFLALGLAVLARGLWGCWTEFQLRSAAATAQGEVTSRTQGMRRGAAHYWVYYTFLPEGRGVVSSLDEIGDKDAWDGVKKGSKIPVLYLRGRPSVHRLRLDARDWLEPGLTASAGVAMVVLSVLIIRVTAGYRELLPSRRRRRRAATGPR